MQPVEYHGGRVRLYPGDCLATLKGLPSDSVDAVVTDPPYALVSIVKRFGKDGAAPAQGDVYARASAGFMGQAWDVGDTAFAVDFWREVYRVLKPGGHVAAFGGTRTCHQLTTAIEGAGFEIRDRLTWIICADTHVAQFLASLSDEQQRAFVRCIEESQFGGDLAWIFGSGFPKSHDVAKGIDAKLLTGSARTEDLRRLAMGDDYQPSGRGRVNYDHGGGSAMNGATAPGGRTPEAMEWQGWGTALKPALEPIALARKPLIGTVTENVLAHGTGAIHIAACRVGEDERENGPASATSMQRASRVEAGYRHDDGRGPGAPAASVVGRWPANVLHDGSDEVLNAFPAEAGAFAPVRGLEPSALIAQVYGARSRTAGAFHADTGSAARFFYSAKADADDRIGSKHPTVKPVDLTRWLVRLICPPGGTVLDPFAGTGTTGEAAFREGFSSVLCEREPACLLDIARRMDLVTAGPAIRRAESAKARNKTPKPAPLFGES